jgi:hypothetical protein
MSQIPTIRLTAAPENVGARPSAPSALSDPEITPLRSKACRRPDGGRYCGRSPANAVTVRTKPFKSNAGTVADGADTNGARRSGAAELQPVLTTLRTVHGCRRIACTTALQYLAKAVEYGDLAKTPTSSNQKRDFQELEQRVFQELEQRFTVLAVLADNEQLLADESK